MIDFNNLPLTLGDYELRELVSDSGRILTFEAVQLLIHRKVILSLVKPECADEATISSFLDSARAKAKVKEGRICSVFEATNSNGLTYYTQEQPAGDNLEKLIAQGQQLEPVQVARIIKELAISQIYYEQNALKVAPWEPSSVFLDKNGETSFLNLVEAGTRSESETPRDQGTAGHFFPSITMPGQPGMTRVLTLCSWMTRGPDAPRGLNWAMILELCETIIDQLTATDLSTTSPYARSSAKRGMGWKHWSIAAILLLGAGFAIFQILKPSQGQDAGSTAAPPPPSLDISEWEHRPDKELTIYDQEINATRKLSVDLHEVTIQSYEKFLHFISGLNEEQVKLFRDPETPESKTSYIPSDWFSMLDAAKNGGTWNDQKVTMLSPVANVDYWDALAYAKWSKRRLITQPEWKAILGDGNAKLPRHDPYGPVTAYQHDITASGIGGMAGGVAEWTATQSVNLAMPMSGKKPLVCGGSYSNGGDAHTEEHVDSETAIRADLGFRTVKDI